MNSVRIHTEMVRRMSKDLSVEPMEMAGFMEDVANLYLAIAEEFSQIARERREK